MSNTFNQPSSRARLYVRDGSRVPYLAIVFAIFALVLSAIVAYLLFQQSMARQYQAIQIESNQLAVEFDHELKFQSNDIESLHAIAVSALKDTQSINIDPIEYLSPLANKNGYTLSLPNGYRDNEIGNITGLGNVPDANSLIAKQMRMAIALTPLFESITQRNPDLPWVYYTSRDDFVYLYPRVSETDYFYETSLKQKEFFVGATPEKNPSRKAFWTPIYEDAGGKGLMVTISKPLYLNDQFLGSLSIDTGIKTLAWMLRHHAVSGSNVELVDARGRFMLNSKTLSQNMFAKRQDDLVSEYALKAVDWRIVVRTAKRPLVEKALKESAIYGVIILLMMMSLILITMLVKALRKVHVLSVRDFLTGLYNRRYFDEAAHLEFDRAKRTGAYLALALIDIDYFKRYNDSYGHHAGDKALQMVAESLSSSLLRASDKLFRVGGEEFALIATFQDPAQLEPLMNDLCKNIRDLGLAHKSSPVGVLTISIGATVVRTESFSDVSESYQCADRALYRAKESGRNRVEVDLRCGAA